jgi:hypothetical protein
MQQIKGLPFIADSDTSKFDKIIAPYRYMNQVDLKYAVSK